MINRNDWNGLNFQKLKEHAHELETYDGVLPLQLYHYINILNRIEYLESINQTYEYAYREKHRQEQKKKTEQERINAIEDTILEIIDFVNNNPEFTDIIKCTKK